MQTNLFRILKFVSLATAIFLASVGCRKVEERPLKFQLEMRDSYAAAFALFRDIWSPDRFKDSQNEKEIVSLLDRLSTNFHGVEKKATHSTFDAGFAIALQMNQEIIQDAKRRFQEGKIDYAAWQLRGLMHNCVACHTRYQAPITFIGEAPAPASASPEDALEVADFLVATRQFDPASAALLKIASSPGAVTAAEQPEFRALKLWLVVQLRSAPNFKVIAHQLEVIAQHGHFRGEASSAVIQWIRDLKQFPADASSKATLQDAKNLLGAINPDNRFSEDDAYLVPILLASSILHNLLPTLTDGPKREATYLLGLANSHIQIRELEVFRVLYLEQCIREFPNTDEAKKAFGLYEKQLQFESSGSEGMQMEDEDKVKLEALRELAFDRTAKVSTSFDKPSL